MMKQKKLMVAALTISFFCLAGPVCAAQWYDGGDSLRYPSCDITPRSPAEEYEGFSEGIQKLITPAQIIDHGEQVEVKVGWSVGESFFYFRSKQACLKNAAEQKARDATEDRQEKEHLDQYR
jgi:hypothetical protein